jgi:hypothetical protein
MQLQHPGVMLAAERLLLAAAPLNGGVVFGWGAVATLGAAAAPFYLAPYQLALYFACALPLRSSFYLKARLWHGAQSVDKRSAQAMSLPRLLLTRSVVCLALVFRAQGARAAGGGRTPPEALALAPREAALQAAAAVALPAACYAAVHRSALLSSTEHTWSLLLLTSVPTLTLCLTTRQGALWWAAPSAFGPRGERGSDDAPSARFTARRNTVALAAALGAAAGFEGRVVLHSFRAYVRAPPPWDAFLVTAALLPAAAVAAAAALGMLPSPAPRTRGGAGGGAPRAFTLAASALSASSLAAAFAVGMPLWLVPAPLLGAAAAAQFYRHRSGWDYALCCAACFVCLLWFLSHHFMFLDVALAGGVPLHRLCVWLLAAAACAAAAPAAAAAPGSRARGVAALALATHAGLLAAAEATLYDEGVYPPYLVAFTSVVGVALAASLRAKRRLAPGTAWLLGAVFSAKAAVLVLPSAAALPRVIALALAASAPFGLPLPRGGGGAVARASAHFLAATLAILAARFEFFDALFAASGRRPSDALLFGSLLFALGVFVAALAARLLPHAGGPRRAALALLAAGGGLLALRPPLPWRGDVGFWYDAAHVPDPEPDDAALYGMRGAARGDHAGWPAWLLLGALIAAVLAATTPRGSSGGRGARGSSSSPVAGGIRALAAAAAGGALGLYAAFEYFPDDETLRICVVASCAAGVLFVERMGATPHGAPPPRWLPLLFAAQVTLLPAGLLMISLDDIAAAVSAAGGPLGGRAGAEAAARAAEARAGLIATHAALAVAAAFAVKLKLSGMMADVAPSSAFAGRRASPFVAPAPAKHDAFAPFLGRRPATLPPLAGALAARALDAAGASWLPATGNCAALLAFGLALVLNHGITGSSCASIFALAPLLLLLSGDAGALAGLGTAQRYAPPAAAVWLFLTALGAVRAAAAGAAGGALPGGSAWDVRRNAVAVALAQPNGVLLLRFLWVRSAMRLITLPHITRSRYMLFVVILTHRSARPHAGLPAAARDAAACADAAATAAAGADGWFARAPAGAAGARGRSGAARHSGPRARRSAAHAVRQTALPRRVGGEWGTRTACGGPSANDKRLAMTVSVRFLLDAQ